MDLRQNSRTYIYFRRFGLLIFMCIQSAQIAYAQFHEIDSLENLMDREDDTVKVLNLIKLSDLYRQIDYDKSFDLARKSIDLAQRLDYDEGEYKAVGKLSELFQDRGDLFNTLIEAQRQLTIAERLENDRLAASCCIRIGNTFNFLDQASRAVEMHAKAYKLYEKLNDKLGLARALNGLGQACDRTSDFKQAEKYYHQAFDIVKEQGHKDYMIRVLINIGATLEAMSDGRNCFAYYFEALKLAEENNKQELIAYILLSLGEAYYKTGQHDKAINYYEMASLHYDRIIANGKTFNNPNKAACLTGLGNILIKKQQYQRAVASLHQALTALEGSDHFPGLIRANRALATAYEKIGDYRKALDFKTKQLIASDSVNNRRQRERANELQVVFRHEQNEKTLKVMQKERTFNKILVGLSSGLILVISLGVTLFVEKFRLRIKKDDEITKADQQRYEAEIKAREFTEKQLRQELEFKTTELTTFTLHMIQKNEVLDEVRKEIDEIRKVSPDDVRNRISKLLNSINLSYRNDKDWESFKLYFDQVHKGFFDNLKASYPELNGKDLKLCALLRLNLDTKQIATIMDISPDSAKVARHRIRKKIGLSSDDNLHSFLNTL